ncbi:hypothetical protein ABTL77_20020, partial [Acinetobacter baumannii]
HPGNRRLPSRRRHCAVNPAIGRATLRETAESPGIAEIIARELSLMGARNQPFSIRSRGIAPIWLAIVAGVSILTAPAAAQAQGAVKSVH